MADNIITISIEKELEESYLSYAMSVIMGRALPDIRDGLKPVHRRILYAMHKAGFDYGKPYRKSARIVGDVMGKYHPHGDAAIYDAMARMAQDFSILHPLVDGQGNWGSIDDDPPAAMRYTEARFQKITHYLVNDINEDTVDFRPNYDGNESEPVVLPAEFPNLLVNGTEGIAVGIATNIPTHNLGEVIDACLLYIDNSEITVENILAVMPGPDFPTGGVILGKTAIRSAFTTGRGIITVQGKTHIEDLPQEKQAIVIDEIPYQVNKAKLVTKIVELVKEKKVEDIVDIRDESDKSGIRVVIELKRNASTEFILNQIFVLTDLRSRFSINMNVLHGNAPIQASIKEMIAAFIEFRKEVLIRRTKFRLKKTREKAHIFIGLYVAVLNIDEVISIIRGAKDPAEACKQLLEKKWNTSAEIREMIKLITDSDPFQKDSYYQLTEAQAKAILDMKLQRLTGLEKEKLEHELKLMLDLIKEYIDFLGSEEKLMEAIKLNLQEIKTKFAQPRRTVIEEGNVEYEAEDLIPQEDMVVTVTMNGYIKRVKLSHYRTQRRGGKGKLGQAVKEEDVTTKLFVVNTHTSVLFFSNIGRVYKLKVYKLPLAEPTARGRSLVNIFPLSEGETITNVMPLPQENDNQNLNIIFATAYGNIRRNALADFEYVQSNGKTAILLSEGDKLISVEVCKEGDHVFLSTKTGKSIRFPASGVRQFKSRTSDGVRAIKLQQGDSVISMSVLNGYAEVSDMKDSNGMDSDIEDTNNSIIGSDVEDDIQDISDEVGMTSEIRNIYLKVPLTKRIEAAKNMEASGSTKKLIDELGLKQETFVNMAINEQLILSVTENGFGKRTSAYEYRVTRRGGVGITNILTTKRNGKVIASFSVEYTDNIMLITDQGKLIRIEVNDIRVAGRSTQGVILFKTEPNEKVVSVAKVVDAESPVVEDLEVITDAI
ncbi:MAG: DNA gyrase subunit A [Candidatus Mesenet longicola]|uniref:DNA gyrase subunit A n=1 Tax=Candidatus Mesenet longicola TaxID=1892558 RepID=A0A8J3HU24_9RICK|nr:MAG: DNA gyrase subunit A [Candidatus Mesenet longicola]GHM59242.1 MAG: DNA gyrase subunit A [Candidatus Mesenet longicola]